MLANFFSPAVRDWGERLQGRRCWRERRKHAWGLSRVTYRDVNLLGRHGLFMGEGEGCGGKVCQSVVWANDSRGDVVRSSNNHHHLGFVCQKMQSGSCGQLTALTRVATRALAPVARGALTATPRLTATEESWGDAMEKAIFVQTPAGCTGGGCVAAGGKEEGKTLLELNDCKKLRPRRPAGEVRFARTDIF